MYNIYAKYRQFPFSGLKQCVARDRMGMHCTRTSLVGPGLCILPEMQSCRSATHETRDRTLSKDFNVEKTTPVTL